MVKVSTMVVRVLSKVNTIIMVGIKTTILSKIVVFTKVLDINSFNVLYLKYVFKRRANSCL